MASQRKHEQIHHKTSDELCVRAIMAVSCQCTCDNCSAKGLCEPWLVVPHLCKLSARDWQRAFEPHASKNRTLWCHRRSPSPKLYIPILVISSVLKRCIREMMLASAFLLFQTMWFWSRCKDDIFTDLRTLYIKTTFHISLIYWLVEDKNQFATGAFTIALFPLWKFLCLLIDFMLAVQRRLCLYKEWAKSMCVRQTVRKPSPICRNTIKHHLLSFLSWISETKNRLGWPSWSMHIKTSQNCVHLNSTSHL